MSYPPGVGVSATVICEVTVLLDGQPQGVLDGIAAGPGVDSDAQTTGGYITLDTTAANLRTLYLQCVDTEGILIPSSDGGGALQPTGVELAVQTGFQVGGVNTLWPQGVFGVTEVDTAHGAGGENSSTLPGPILTVTGADRSAAVSANLFEDTFTIPQGTTATDAIMLVMASQAPHITATAITPSDFVVAQQVFSPGDDPWQEILGLAVSAGMVAYFDAAGTFVVCPIPSTGSPVQLLLADGAGQVMNAITATTSNQPGYNGVVVTGSSVSAVTSDGETTTTTTPVTGTAFDMNPASPTYCLGPYGFRAAPAVQVSTVISQAQANAAAASLLPQVLGLTRSIALDTIPLPFLEAYDLVYAVNTQTQVDGSFIVQQATIPLDFSTLESLTCIPLGSPLDQLSGLKTLAVAGFTTQSPLSSGGATYSYTSDGYTYGSTGSSGGLLGGGGSIGGVGMAGLRLHRGVRVLWDGAKRWTESVTGWSIEDDSDDAADGVEDGLGDIL